MTSAPLASVIIVIIQPASPVQKIASRFAIGHQSTARLNFHEGTHAMITVRNLHGSRIVVRESRARRRLSGWLSRLLPRMGGSTCMTSNQNNLPGSYNTQYNFNVRETRYLSVDPAQARCYKIVPVQWEKYRWTRRRLVSPRMDGRFWRRTGRAACVSACAGMGGKPRVSSVHGIDRIRREACGVWARRCPDTREGGTAACPRRFLTSRAVPLAGGSFP